MADRTHATEEDLTRSRTSEGGRGEKDTRPPAATGVYQEGRVDSVGGGPSGTDRDDRSGEGQGVGIVRDQEGRSPDDFVSSEVNARTSRPDKRRG
jgi:hypothetical protein